jgi:hypothetical protein
MKMALTVVLCSIIGVIVAATLRYLEYRFTPFTTWWSIAIFVFGITTLHYGIKCILELVEGDVENKNVALLIASILGLIFAINKLSGYWANIF